MRVQVILLAIVSLPAQPSSEIRVEVRDASGAGVEASVLAEALEGTFRRSVRSDARGTAAISGLAPGAYRIRVSKDGFATHAAAVDVPAGASVTHPVTLAVGPSVYGVTVTSATPLPGLDRDLSEVPAPVQAASDMDLRATGAMDLSAFLNRRMNNVYLNEIQGNPFQADLNYRGYSASPLLGTPQGLSVYMDGVRLNQPFGDVVSWDLVPRAAISEMAMIPGSNPLFGLNTLGGSLSVRTKDGISHPGSMVQVTGGSFGRKMADLEHGGAAARGLNWFLAGSLMFEDGWRDTSPTNVRQFFSKIGSQRGRTAAGLTLAYSNNALIGNGLQEHRLLARDRSSIYTKPDVTANRAPFLNLNVRRSLSRALSFSGNAYFRYIRTITLNGDANEESLDQSLYQPNANERAALARAGFTGFPASGETAANTPFPFWRCIANVLLADEPSEKCNGLLNRSNLHQRNYGVAGQVSWLSRRNQLTVGVGYDGNRAGFAQSAEFGYLIPDRSITPVGAFGDAVDMAGSIRSASIFATDTLTLANRLHVTMSGRYNRTTIDNTDRIRPIAGTGSLTGRHSFSGFNPAVGAAYRATGVLSFYGGFTQGSRAPTAIELGCADPNSPCRLPNAMAGDPPLEQVVARTFEAGVRGTAEGNLRWSAGWFRGVNREDILFVASEQTGFGYFKNFERTRRQGVELSANWRFGRVTLGGGYTFLDATFQSEEEVNGSGNSTNEEARDGIPGTEGVIEIEPGNRIPLVPRHMVKAFTEIQVTPRLVVDFDAAGITSSFARGNENNLHQPDGRYYLGEGSSPGYVVANLGARFDVHPRVQLFVQVNNLFNRQYTTAAQLGATGFTATGSFIARPFPAIGGEFPVQQSAFFAPGAPRGAWGGLRIRF